MVVLIKTHYSKPKGVEEKKKIFSTDVTMDEDRV
jgi:hypothetical protein